MLQPRLAGVLVVAALAVAPAVKGHEGATNTKAHRSFVTFDQKTLMSFVPSWVLPQGGSREFSVHARKYAFNPQTLEVQQDDLVKVTLISDDIPHSFTVDNYRIARRVGGGQTTVFEFRADQAGKFPFYCNLTADERCKEMHGELVVNRK
jgi:heme/copper-type cytochrome/quinol oxidase subunit 2